MEHIFSWLLLSSEKYLSKPFAHFYIVLLWFLWSHKNTFSSLDTYIFFRCMHVYLDAWLGISFFNGFSWKTDFKIFCFSLFEDRVFLQSPGWQGCNFWSSCLSLPCPRTTGLKCHAYFLECWWNEIYPFFFCGFFSISYIKSFTALNS